MLSRRHALSGLLGLGAGLPLAGHAIASTTISDILGSLQNTTTAERLSSARVAPALMTRALRALNQRPGVFKRDVIGVVDFDAPSSAQRFHLIDLVDGRSTSYLVAHGRGSDPEHAGWLRRFSNDPGSEASSNGAFLTSATYEGKHGLSRRVIGLDPTNSNAEPRAIVVHAASYVSLAILAATGKLGRSEGCFAVAPDKRDEVMARLGEGRLIYADKVAV
jgi:hypothetical protein